jgi:gluconate:H+ symporter, GntP family
VTFHECHDARTVPAAEAVCSDLPIGFSFRPAPKEAIKTGGIGRTKSGAAHARGNAPGNEVSVSMSAAPLLQAAALLAAVIVIALATRSGRLHPFLALLIVATGFGFAGGLSTSLIGKAFGAGFSQAIYSSGLAIVAAGFIGGIVETTAASDWLAATLQRQRWFGSTGLATLVGLVAGLGAAPASAFALLTPFLRAIGGGNARSREALIAPALAISAGHGLILFSPVVVAAVAILGAGWERTILIGVPVAIVVAAFGAAWAQWRATSAQPHTAVSQPKIDDERSGWSAAVLMTATAIPILMLIVQSLGNIPSEPLGGGSTREALLGVGRPLLLFLVPVGLMAAGLWRRARSLLTETGWTGRILGNVASVLLLVGAAGGLQRLCQETGMAELLGERLLSLHLGFAGGILLPFVIAAAIKVLQGSSLVAAITTAGMVQPLLTPLGIDGETAKALAALAIGAGSMTLSHVNDEYFWLVSANAQLEPLRGLTVFTAATLLQGLVAVAALLIVSKSLVEIAGFF